MKQYIKPQAVIVNVNFAHQLLELSNLRMNVNTTESHSATEAYSRGGGSSWDDEELLL